jgi:hypothetical protein
MAVEDGTAVSAWTDDKEVLLGIGVRQLLLLVGAQGEGVLQVRLDSDYCLW